jgi:hypothetical protein
MSDRQGSVRTGSRSGDDAAPKDAAPTGGVPAAAASSTQAISNTAGLHTQAGGAQSTGQVTGAAPAGTAAPGVTSPVGVPGQGGAPAKGKRPGQPTVTARTGRTAKGGRGPRRARLQLRHVDIWSAFKISLVLSIALFFIWMVAIGILYGVLSGLGVFTTLNDLFGQLGSATGSGGKSEVITPGIVFGGAAVIGAINVVLMTALCTVGTFIYNLCSDLVGGLEVTLSERD